MAKVGFGGGCHWCTEGVFQALRGVTQVDQGFLQSMAPADTWAEGVIVVKRRPKLTPNMRPKLTPLRSVPGPAARRVAVS
ncbi:peptide-methionine (S)-S-oxide reductase [Xanthobacter sp. V2C-8]|uniref:peptide-methionine (S)-S-oxide reductase n=1 Tax=Xanthobacter albus TaxID=3119929 RepID=UPI0037282B99